MRSWSARRGRARHDRPMATRISNALPRDLRYEPTAKRVRAELAGTTMADSTGTLLVWESRRAVPVYAFPAADVRTDVLRDSDAPIAGAHGGDAEFWTAEVGDTVAEGRRSTLRGPMRSCSPTRRRSPGSCASSTRRST